MTISRRDTIIIAVLINVGLLAVLFMTALHFEDEPIIERPEAKKLVAMAEPVRQELPVKKAPEILLEPITKPSDTPIDEMDQVIQTITAKPVEPKVEAPQFVEVTVKRGDALEKIARHNGTTIRELKRINNLNNDTLTIGQVIKVPAGKKPTMEIAAVEEVGATYYTLKSGDNPWKIARQNGVDYDDILRLNDLDEENARKLKPGDRIRVK